MKNVNGVNNLQYILNETLFSFFTSYIMKLLIFSPFILFSTVKTYVWYNFTALFATFLAPFVVAYATIPIVTMRVFSAVTNDDIVPYSKFNITILRAVSFTIPYGFVRHTVFALMVSIFWIPSGLMILFFVNVWSPIGLILYCCVFGSTCCFPMIPLTILSFMYKPNCTRLQTYMLQKSRFQNFLFSYIV